MIVGSIARRYALALLSIGIDNKTYEGLGREVERLARAYKESAELKDVLQNPVFPLSQRKRVLEDLAHALALSPTMHSFAMLLLDRNRIHYLPDIALKMRSLVDAQAGRVRARLTSARPLDIAAEVRIKGALERATGKAVILEKTEDPALLGGVVTQIGDMVYDGSLRTSLYNMRQKLLGD